MAGNDLRELVWRSLLGSDYRARYYRHLASSLEARGRRLTIAIGVLSSGAFVILVSRFAIEIPWLAEIFSLVAAALSWILTVVQFSKSAALASNLGKKWDTIYKDHEQLWSEIDRLDAKTVLKRWREIEDRHAELDEIAAVEFPLKAKLAERSQLEVLRERRLSEAA